MSDDIQGTNPDIEEIVKKVIQSSEQLSSALPVLGNVLFLYMQSSVHKHYFVRDMEARVIPALMQKQCKLYVQKRAASLPMAYVSWAFLSDEAEEGYIQSQKLGPKDWNSGDNLWVIDVITPFGGTMKIFNELNENIFKDREINILYPDNNGSLVKTTLTNLTSNNDDEVKH